MTSIDMTSIDMTSIDQQLADLTTDLQRELAALYADHLEQVNKVPVSDLGGLKHALLWKVYKDKRKAAGAVYDAAHAALFSRRSRAK